jgi:predicted CopG family antitoxin
MKTITLNDEAYERLKSWKSTDSDSFSKVVLKVVPKKGTAADMEEAFASLKPLSDSEAKQVVAALEWSNQWGTGRNPWDTQTTDLQQRER